MTPSVPLGTDPRQQAEQLLEAYGIDAVTAPDFRAWLDALDHAEPAVFVLHALCVLERHFTALLLAERACLAGLVSAHDELRVKSARQSASLLDLKTELSRAASELHSDRMAALVRNASLGQPYGSAKDALPTGTSIVNTIRAQLALQEGSR